MPPSGGSTYLVLTGIHEGLTYRFRLAPGANTVGSHRSSDICLEVSGISKHHAVLRLRGHEVLVEDLASKNGTFLNEQPIHRAEANSGDRLGFSQVSLRLETTSAADARLAIQLDGAPTKGDSSYRRTPWIAPASRHSPSALLQLELLDRVTDHLSTSGDDGVSSALEVACEGLRATGLALLELTGPGRKALLAASGEPRTLPPDFLLVGPDHASRHGAHAPLGHLPPRSGEAAPAGVFVTQSSCDEEGYSLAPALDSPAFALVLWGVQGSVALSIFLRTLLRLVAPSRESAAVGAETPRRKAQLTFPPGWLPGSSPAMAAVYRDLRSIAPSDLPVLLLGETGTGKEGMARALHLSSGRTAGPFVAINCAALPSELLEAELFGIGSGVATGVTARQGRFLEANGGTLFLDEISDMLPPLQAKLLRVLQEGEVSPLGQAPRPVDARIVSATHTDLDLAIREGRFRQDLFYRLAGSMLTLPPLRQRQEDIPGLVAHFMTRAARLSQKGPRGLTQEAMQLLLGQPWPGNIRQLNHAVERWVHLCSDHQAIDAALVKRDLPSLSVAAPTAAKPPRAMATQDPDFSRWPCLDFATIEQGLLGEALRRSDGNMTQAAKALGLTRQSLRRRLERHGLLP